MAHEQPVDNRSLPKFDKRGRRIPNIGLFPDIDGEQFQVCWIGTMEEARDHHQTCMAALEREQARIAALPPAPPCCIYVIADRSRRAVKIGVSKNPDARLRELQIGNSNKVIIHRTYEAKSQTAARLVEKRAHRILQSRALMGEWFEVTPVEAGNAIEDAAARVSVRLGITAPRAKRPPQPPCGGM